MSTPPPIRSNFVTVVAIVFIALAGFATLIALLQNLMFQLLFEPMLQRQMATQPLPAGLPPAAAWVFGHMIWFFRAFLLLSAITLAAAIGLLRRHDWARRLFIALLALGIACQLPGIGLQWWWVGSVQHLMLPPNAPAHFADDMRGFMLAMRIFSALFAIVLCVLFGWIIRRLCSAPVRAEFGVIHRLPDRSLP